MVICLYIIYCGIHLQAEILLFGSLQAFRSVYSRNKVPSFPLRISSVNVTNSQFPADLVTFTEEILNEKLCFLCSDNTESVFAMLTKNDFKKVRGGVNMNFEAYKHGFFIKFIHEYCLEYCFMGI